MQLFGSLDLPIPDIASLFQPVNVLLSFLGEGLTIKRSRPRPANVKRMSSMPQDNLYNIQLLPLYAPQQELAALRLSEQCEGLSSFVSLS